MSKNIAVQGLVRNIQRIILNPVVKIPTHPNLTSHIITNMEGVQGAEGGREEYHEILTENSVETPSKVRIPKGKQELPLLFRAFRSDGRKFPIGSFTEMAVRRKVQDLTGIIADRVTMITPNNVLIEFPLGSPISG